MLKPLSTEDKMRVIGLIRTFDKEDWEGHKFLIDNEDPTKLLYEVLYFIVHYFRIHSENGDISPYLDHYIEDHL